MSAFIKISPSNFGYTHTTSLSFYPDNYTIANYTDFVWSFGDNTNSLDITPTHIYQSSGKFNVQLYATDPYGNSVFLTSSVNINGILSDRDIGYANATNFNFSIDPNYAKIYKAVLWNFGDGETSRNPFPSHQYKTPGKYNVYASVYTNSGGSYTYSKQIEVNLFLNESIYFDIIPPPTFAGHLNRYPFKINITSSDTGDHYIDLGSQFSKSYQYQEPENNWSFLRPQWKFLDLDGNQINSIKTQDTIIKIDDSGNINPNGYVIGVTGTAQFYFVDDLYNSDLYLQKQPYSTIIATLQTSAIRSIHDSLNSDKKTPSYSNSLASVTLPHIFSWREPDYIRISQNGINPISNIRFIGQQNPILIDFGFNKIFINDDLIDGNGVKTSSEFEFPNYVPFDDTTMFDLFSSTKIPVSLSAYDLNGTELDFVYSPSAIKFNFKDKDGFKTGGYYKGSFVNKNSSIDCYIEGSGYFPIPDVSSKYISPVLWISNPMAGMMGTAQYYYNKGVSAVTLNYLDKVHVNSFNLPIIESFNDDTFFTTNTFAVSGFHGVSNIAALPGPSYHAWMVDSELNKLYRVNSVGDILIDIDLNAVLTKLKYSSIPAPNFLIPDQVSPMGIALDSQKNIWVAFYDTPYVFKFDNLGNYITYTNFNNIENVENPRFIEWWRDQSDAYSISMATDDNYPIQPTFIETDLNDNVWVTYSNPFSGWLVKYLSSGNILNSVQYDAYVSPLEIVCDNTNNIWICTDRVVELPPPIAFWKLDETKGSRYDIISNLEATETGDHLGYSEGIQGNAVNISDGNQAWLTLPAGICDIGSDQKSFSIWFKLNYNDVGYQWIGPMQGKGDDYSEPIIAYIESDNTITSLFTTTGVGPWTNQMRTSIQPTANEWHHVVVTYSGTEAKLYYDGEKVASSSYEDPILFSNGEYTLGHYNPYPNTGNVVPGGVFSGQIDELGIWDRVLSDDEIFLLYNNRSGESYSSRFPFSSPKGGYLEKRDTNGVLLTSYGPFAGINHLTLDVNQNPWFTFSYQWAGVINSQTGEFSSINVTDNSYSDKIPDWFYPDYNTEETALEGITSDILGKIYIINSIENKVFVINSSTQVIEDRFRLNPKGFVYTLSAEKAPTQLEYNPWSKSAKAVGDWSGFRWINKYQALDYNDSSYINYNGVTYKAISGTTLPNNISFYPPNYYDIFKINENFDLGEQMKSLAFMPSLLESENLFNFLKDIYGQAPFKHDDLGVLAYEKIANFVSNQSDVDTCDVDSLYDLAASVDMNSDDFRLNFPLAIKRAMNVLSVNQSRLFGGEMDDSLNFNSYNKYHNFNRGELLSSLSYSVTAGTPVLLKSKSLNSYKLIPTGQLHLNPDDVEDYNLISLNKKGNENYSLDILAYSLNLGNDWQSFYEFYEFLPSQNIINTDNIIDWDNFNVNKQNYIQFLKNQEVGDYPDSYLKWDTDNGMMEFIFTYLFYKGLGFI
jgi:hypothetical protein